ncbi:MAG: ribbon-helix-helix domain-containing protein [Spirochaetaceae bacterium]|jgi:hypothetical protein|nr:ribbon-helix-helix domain-containing protein [Spirochaetaceae bacterium]
MTSLRLPADVEQKVFSFARTRNLSKSAVILTALEQFFEQEEDVDSFRIGVDYFGRFGSGAVASSYAEAARVFAQTGEAVTGGESYASEPAANGETVETGRLSTDYKKLMKGKILAKYRSC